MEEPEPVEPPTTERGQTPQVDVCGLTSLAAAGRVQVLLMAATSKRADAAAEDSRDANQTAAMQIEDQVASAAASVPQGKRPYEDLLKENELLARENEGLRLKMKLMEVEHCKEVNQLLYKLINKYAPCHPPDAPSPSPSSVFANTGAFGQAMQHSGHMLQHQQHQQHHRGGGSVDALFNPFGAGPAMNGAGMHHQHMQDPSLRLYPQQPVAGADHSPARSRAATPLPPGTLTHALLSQHAPLSTSTPSNGYNAYLQAPPPPPPQQPSMPLSLGAFLNPDPLLSALQGLPSSTPSLLQPNSHTHSQGHSQGHNGHSAPPRSTVNGGLGNNTGASKRRSRPGASSRSQGSSDVRVVSVLGDKLWGALSTGLGEHGVGAKLLQAYVTALHKAIAAFDRSLRKGRKLSGPVTLSTLPELSAFLIRFPRDLVQFFRPTSTSSSSTSTLSPLLSGGLDATPLREFLSILGLYYSEERDALASLDPLKSAALKRHYSHSSATPSKPTTAPTSSPTVAKPIALSAVLGLASANGATTGTTGSTAKEDAAGAKPSKEAQAPSAPADVPRAPAVSHILFAPIPSTSAPPVPSAAPSTSTSTSTSTEPPAAPKPAPAVDAASSGGVVNSPLPSSPTDASGTSLSTKRASRERRLVSELKSLGLLHGPQTDVHVHLDLTKLYGMGLFRHLPNPAEGLPMHNLFGLFAETDGESDRSVRVVYILSRQQQRLPALPRDEWFTVDKILAEYRKGEAAGISSFCSKDKAAKVKADLLRFPTERALQAELPEPSSSSRKRRPSSSHSHSPLSPPHQQSPMDKRLKAEGTGSAGPSSAGPKPSPSPSTASLKPTSHPSLPASSSSKRPPTTDPLSIAPLSTTQLRPDPSSQSVLDSSLPPDSPSLLDDTTSAELVLTEFIHLGVVSARAGIAELRQMDLKDLAGYGMEEFWQVPQAGRRPAVRPQLFAARFSDRVERKQIKGRRVRMIEVVYTDKQVQWFDMQGLLQAYTGVKGLEAKQGIVRFLSREEAALAFEAADAQKLAEGAEGGEAAADEDPLLLDSSDLEDADVKPAPVPAPSVGRSGRASVANRRIHDPDWITGF